MSFYVNYFLTYIVDRDYFGTPESAISALFMDFIAHQFISAERVIIALLVQPYQNTKFAEHLLGLLLFSKETQQRVELFNSLNFSPNFDEPDLLMKLERYSSSPSVKPEIDRSSGFDHVRQKDVPRYFGDYCSRLATMSVFVLERLVSLESHDIYIKFIEVYGPLFKYQPECIGRMFIFLNSYSQSEFIKEPSIRLSTVKLVSRLSSKCSKEFSLFAEDGKNPEFGNQDYFSDCFKLLAEGTCLTSCYQTISNP